jgi:hypothetical protein
MKSLAEALKHEPEDSVSGTHRINSRKSFYPAMRDCRPSDPWILAPAPPAAPGTIGATEMTLMPAKNSAVARYTSQSLTTGLIAGPDLVIVLLSGVIKKYK